MFTRTVCLKVNYLENNMRIKTTTNTTPIVVFETVKKYLFGLITISVRIEKRNYVRPEVIYMHTVYVNCFGLKLLTVNGSPCVGFYSINNVDLKVDDYLED